MDPFQALLLSVSKELTSWDDNALIFLCQDLIPSRTRDLQNAEDVFLKLQENDLLDKNNTFILQELLWCIGRNDLLFKKLKINKETVKAEMDIPGRAKTKPYRRLLFSLAEEVTDEDLKEIKLILHKDISRAKMRNITSMLDIFNEMEKNGSLDGDSLCNVKRIFKENNHILEMIGNYEAKVNDANNFQNVQDNFEKIPQAEDYMLQQVYNMSSKPRGICVVINNFDFGVASKEMSHITDRQEPMWTE
ncbi:caspase-8-like [Discoglossus pictus]